MGRRRGISTSGGMKGLLSGSMGPKCWGFEAAGKGRQNKVTEDNGNYVVEREADRKILDGRGGGGGLQKVKENRPSMEKNGPEGRLAAGGKALPELGKNGGRVWCGYI